MSDIAKLIAESESRLKTAFQETEKRLNDKINAEVNDRKGIVRQRNLAILACAVCLLVAIFAVSNARTANEARDNQVATNEIVLCAQGRATALATRKPEVGESDSHFVNRMAARRALLLSLGGLRCAEQKGFATFAFLRGQALTDIEEILRRLAPRRFKELIEGERGGRVRSALPEAPGVEGPTIVAIPRPPDGRPPPATDGNDQGQDDGQGNGHQPKPKPENPNPEAESKPPPTDIPTDTQPPNEPPVSVEPEPKPEPEVEPAIIEIPSLEVCLKPAICIGRK